MRTVLATIVLAFGAAAAQDVFDSARAGSAEEMVAALAAGGSVADVDDDGNTPLLLAVWHNTADVVTVLLEADADPYYTNPKTGMGIFGLVWRNPDGAAIRTLFAERDLVAFAGVRPGADEAPAEEPPPVAPATPPTAPPERPPVDAPELPERAEVFDADAPTPETAAELGYVYRPGAASSREEVRDWVTSRYALNGTLAAGGFVNGCRAAVLDLMRAPESVMFGDVGQPVLDDEGIISYATYALAPGREGESRRWSLDCTGFVEEGMLHLWVEIEAR